VGFELALDCLEIADALLRGHYRRLRRQATGDVIINELLEVEAQLVVDVGMDI